MCRRPAGTTIVEMVDLDSTQLCAHGYGASDCPLCGSPPPRDEAGQTLFDPRMFDPEVWVAAYVASRREPPEVPAELVGVPLS